ncbi:MAG TPA: AAA family ATPase [Firmicutes bacterium]|nr:AAA family ATPase [Bacillota bacterium]
MGEVRQLRGIERLLQQQQEYSQKPKETQNTVVPFLQRAKSWKAFTAEAKPIKWIWRYVLAKKHVSILAGDPGTGKTTLLRRWFWEVYTQEAAEFLGLATERPRKLLVITEESPDIWKENLNADLSAFEIFFLSTDEIGSLDDWLTFCKELEGFDGDLLIIDSFNAIFCGDSINDATEVNKVLKPLSVATRKAGFATLVLDHHRKDGDIDYGKGVAGSYAKVGSADFVLTLSRANPKDKAGRGRILTVAKTRISVPTDLVEGLHIELTDDGRYLVRGSKRVVAAERWAEEDETLLRALDEAGRAGDPWVEPEKLRATVGCNKNRFAQHVKKLKEDGLLVTNGKGSRGIRYALKQFVTQPKTP